MTRKPNYLPGLIYEQAKGIANIAEAIADHRVPNRLAAAKSILEDAERLVAWLESEEGSS